MTARRAVSTAVAAFVAVLASQPIVWAQVSSYTQGQLNQARQAGNASNFTSQALMRQTINRGLLGNNLTPQTSVALGKLTQNYLTNTGVGAGGPISKPFANANTSSPSVSPYLSLSQPFTSTATNYYTQVRPAIDQQRAIQNQQAQNAQFQRQLNSIQARAPYEITGDRDVAPTGHAAVFQNYLNYYPQSQGGQQRRR